MEIRKLTRQQYDDLQAQYDRTPQIHDSMISGEHYMLMNILNRLGYHPFSREEAIDMAERLLTYGYPD